MKKILFTTLMFVPLAADPGYLKSWATYRLTEMFDHQHDKASLETHFSKAAWKNFETALEKSNISKHQLNDHYETRISQFINPVKITQGNHNTYFAQAAFLVSFHNEHSSWQQPLELILTINDQQGNIEITDFEGKASDPLQVKNYALDRAKACHQ